MSTVNWNMFRMCMSIVDWNSSPAFLAPPPQYYSTDRILTNPGCSGPSGMLSMAQLSQGPTPNRDISAAANNIFGIGGGVVADLGGINRRRLQR